MHKWILFIFLFAVISSVLLYQFFSQHKLKRPFQYQTTKQDPPLTRVPTELTKNNFQNIEIISAVVMEIILQTTPKSSFRVSKSRLILVLILIG